MYVAFTSIEEISMQQFDHMKLSYIYDTHEVLRNENEKKYSTYLKQAAYILLDCVEAGQYCNFKEG